MILIRAAAFIAWTITTTVRCAYVLARDSIRRERPAICAACKGRHS